MKKLVTILLSLLMLASLLAVAASAQSYNPHGNWDLSQVGQIKVKKADPAAVVKDGIIGEGEYERYDLDLDPTSTFLHIAYGTGDNFDDATAMLATMEFYFSWDEVHGFNFAIRNKPPVLQQVLGVKDQDPPEDDFCQNTAYNVRVNDPNGSPTPLFYYSVAKRTDTGEYLEGHWNQLGLTGHYNPVADVDYCITYSDGTSLLEWSIPFENYIENGGPGSVLGFSISATGGTGTEVNWEDHNFYAIALGDMGYDVNPRFRINDAEFLISDDPIKDVIIIDDPTDTQPGTEPGTTAPGATEPGQTSEPGQEPGTPGTPGQQTPGGTAAPRTGDPMVIIAAVSAIGACGAVVIKRKFF